MQLAGSPASGIAQTIPLPPILHPPQLFGSLVVSVQTLPALPGHIVGRLAGHWQVPPTHTVPDAEPGHAVPSGAVVGAEHPDAGLHVPAT